MIRFIKSIFCKHQYKYHQTLYGDAIINAPGRFIDKCTKCGKYRYRKDGFPRH